MGRHQQVEKPVYDTEGLTVAAQRYHCPDCERTFRVYPHGVGRAPTSQRARDLALVLYLLGLSYGATARALEALGLHTSKTRVHAAVHSALGQGDGCPRASVFSRVSTSRTDGHALLVSCSGRWLPLQVQVDDATGLVLVIDGLPPEAVALIEGLPEQVAETTCVRLMLTKTGGA